jgi:hypothetical protein
LLEPPGNARSQISRLHSIKPSHTAATGCRRWISFSGDERWQQVQRSTEASYSYRPGTHQEPSSVPVVTPRSQDPLGVAREPHTRPDDATSSHDRRHAHNSSNHLRPCIL